jgi:hypothetical protein
MAKKRVPRQRKQVDNDLLNGWKGSAISYYNYSISTKNKIGVSPSSFKRIVCELRQKHGEHYILGDKQPTVMPGGTPFKIYFINPEVQLSRALAPAPEPQMPTPGPETIDGFIQENLFTKHS